MATNLPTSPKGGTSTKDQTLPSPSNASEWAYALLLTMGIDPATHTNSLWNLTAQINYEWGGNSVVGNNPLASTQREQSSGAPINSVGVQNYGNWLDGIAGNVSVLQQSNMAPLYKALQDNASIADYSTALGKSCWEGCKEGAAPNIAYGQGVQARFTSMLNGGEGGFPSLGSAYLNYASGGQTGFKIGSPSGPGIGDVPQAAAGITATLGTDIAKDIPWFSGIDAFFNDILGGFGIGWKGVLTIIGGILLIAVGAFFLFRHQIEQTAETAAIR